MSSAKELLERAAYCMDSYAVSEKTTRIAKLMALHLIRRVGDGASEEEAKLLLELLNEPECPTAQEMHERINRRYPKTMARLSE